MCLICTDIITQELACKSEQEALSSHPVLVKMNSLEREKTQLESMLEKEHQSKKIWRNGARKLKENPCSY